MNSNVLLPFCSIVIVSYNPDRRLLDNIKVLVNIESLKDIILVDNSTCNNVYVNECACFEKLKLIRCGENKGIAYAQNMGVKESMSKGYKWVLTLDHDTIVTKQLLQKYYDYIKSHDCSHIALLNTDYYDIGAQKNHLNISFPVEVKEVISSGSLLNVEAFMNLGGMKEFYFIDQVDNEYCFRAIKHGYKIVVLPGVDMEHRLGKTTVVKLFNKKFYLYNQSPIRTFYRTRNIVYFLREYREIKMIKEKTRFLLVDFIKILLEERTMQKISCFIRGLYHGFFDKI